MSNLKGVKPGDELILTGRSAVRREANKTVKTVKVHKVGRTLVHILRYEDVPDGATDAYRIENGIINDGYGHSELWKPEDFEREQTRHELEESLRSHGVEVWRKKQSIDVLEEILAILERSDK